MLTCVILHSGFNHDDTWGHRAGEPNKAVICSLALARLRTDVKGGGDAANNNAVGMAQKLLLFWRKPARRCWWEGVELDNVEGLQKGTKLKVWIRRVWTLEMVSGFPLRGFIGRMFEVRWRKFRDVREADMNEWMGCTWEELGLAEALGFAHMQ
jgi:hypothetical protein